MLHDGFEREAVIEDIGFCSNYGRKTDINAALSSEQRYH